MTLTKRQREVMAMFVGPDGDDVNEGRIADECYPLILRPRSVVNALVKKGLLRLDGYIDEEVGYALCLTDTGRDWLGHA